MGMQSEREKFLKYLYIYIYIIKLCIKLLNYILKVRYEIYYLI